MTYKAPEAKQYHKPPQTGSVEAGKGLRETVISKEIINSIATELSQTQDRAYGLSVTKERLAAYWISEARSSVQGVSKIPKMLCAPRQEDLCCVLALLDQMLCDAYWLSEAKELRAAHQFSEATELCATYWPPEPKELYAAY